MICWNHFLLILIDTRLKNGGCDAYSPSGLQKYHRAPTCQFENQHSGSALGALIVFLDAYSRPTHISQYLPKFELDLYCH